MHIFLSSFYFLVIISGHYKYMCNVYAYAMCIEVGPHAIASVLCFENEANTNHTRYAQTSKLSSNQISPPSPPPPGLITFSSCDSGPWFFLHTTFQWSNEPYFLIAYSTSISNNVHQSFLKIITISSVVYGPSFLFCNFPVNPLNFILHHYKPKCPSLCFVTGLETFLYFASP